MVLVTLFYHFLVQKVMARHIQPLNCSHYIISFLLVFIKKAVKTALVCHYYSKKMSSCRGCDVSLVSVFILTFA